MVQNKLRSRVLSTLALILATGSSHATAVLADSLDEALQLTVQRDDEWVGLELTWYIAPGFFIDRETITATLNGRRIPVMTPSGVRKYRAESVPREIYRGIAMANTVGEELPNEGEIYVTYQGCNESSVCYPQVTKSIDLATLSVRSSATPGEINDDKQFDSIKRVWRLLSPFSSHPSSLSRAVYKVP